EKGISSLALTNINSTADCWDFVDFCRRENINPIMGCEIRNSDRFCYILLAKDDGGLAEINRFLTVHFQSEKEFPERPLLQNVWVVYAFPSLPMEDLNENELMGIRPHQVPRLYGIRPELYPDKWVVLSPVTFQNKTYYNLHRLLRAIGKNTLLTKLKPDETAGEDERFLDSRELAEAFGSYPFIVKRSMEVMGTCGIATELHTGKNKKHFSASREDDRILLEKFALEGLEFRYGKDNREAGERVVKELKIIDQLDFNAYFLIALDVVRYAQNRRCYYLGRVSGGNNMIVHYLRKTDLDPIK